MLFLPSLSRADSDGVKVGQAAPSFKLKTQDGQLFDLASRHAIGWTVLYFYPKAGTPGCTAQACAYRDGLKSIQQQNAEVYGISTDKVSDLKAFHEQHQLSFNLLSDDDGKVTSRYGVKIPLLNIAKRWTFIIDPDLVVRQINDDVDPIFDATRVASSLKELQNKP